MSIFIDFFAGGGGASEGFRRAMGREVDRAVNHDASAIAMHEANHPGTRHFREDVWHYDLADGEDVWGCWFSPDCRHFSRAKGKVPVKKEIRGLAWIMIKVARMKRPRVMFLENVREFQDWGPLIPAKDAQGRAILHEDGSPVLVPDPERKSITFRRFVGNLRALGYCVEWRELNAADYGAPTNRRRLFLIARCDGEAIVWPVPTHGPGRALPYRTAAECIDWSLPCPSIFERKRPLREKTMRRIARGIQRYVIESAEPFIVGCGGPSYSGKPVGVNRPMNAQTAENHRAVVTPYLIRPSHGKDEMRGQVLGKPLGAITKENDKALIAPVLSQIDNAGDGSDRASDPRRPLRTITSKQHDFLIAPHLSVFHGQSVGQPVTQPGPSLMGQNHVAIVAPWIVKHFGGQTGRPATEPLPTTTSRGTQNQIAAALLVHMNHGEKQWSDVREPLRVVTSNNHAAEVRAFLIKYYGQGCGQSVRKPLDTVTSRERFGLVTVAGVDYVIVDIGMRMLTPRELARAQGFSDAYVLTGNKKQQVARIGNSVCPPIAAAIIRANCAALELERVA